MLEKQNNFVWIRLFILNDSKLKLLMNQSSEKIKVIKLLLLGVFLLTNTVIYSKEKYRDKRISVEIVSAAPKLELGKDNLFAVKIVLSKGWHIYWKNPGDAGEPTILEITTNLPNQSIIEPEYPIPLYKNTSGIITLEYRNTVYFPFSITIPENFNKDTLEIKLNAKWLVCRQVCIPGKTVVTKRIPLKSRISSNTDFLKMTPTIPRDSILAAIKFFDSYADLTINKEFESQIQKVFFFPLTEGVFDLETNPDFTLNGSKLLIHLPLLRYLWGDKSNIEGILELTFLNNEKKYYNVKVVE